MILTFRPIKIWPDGWRDPNQGREYAPWSPFKADWRDTMDKLGRELGHLGAAEAMLQVDVAEHACRLDGGLKERAVVGYHGVILSFDTAKFGTLTYPCNKFDAHRDPWRHNVRAIALGLESLRRVERYGIADRGQQYAGYKELGTGIALGAGMTMDQAALILSESSIESPLSGRPVFTAAEILNDPNKAQAAYRIAARAMHPDSDSGDAEKFHKGHRGPRPVAATCVMPLAVPPHEFRPGMHNGNPTPICCRCFGFASDDIHTPPKETNDDN